jgi:hypothetical protein
MRGYTADREGADKKQTGRKAQLVTGFIFACGLFNDACSIATILCIGERKDNGLTGNNLEGYNSGLIEVRHYAGICVERLRKTTNNFSQHDRCPDRESNRTLPKYKASVTTTLTCYLLASSWLFPSVILRHRRVGIMCLRNVSKFVRGSKTCVMDVLSVLCV